MGINIYGHKINKLFTIKNYKQYKDLKIKIYINYSLCVVFFSF